MNTIYIITLGKLKESYWREAEAEYIKRLGPLAKIVIHELKEESFSDKDLPDAIKQKEAEKINFVLKKFPGAHVVALDEHGEHYTSVQFSKKLEQFNNTNNLTIFILGGPLGLHRSLRARARETFSLSPLTFTHQMARVILLEQIYRGMMILANRKYHY